ncbi:hypothetical protein EV702DRAFT_1116150 [Suillus placidus]|uniref:Uncharacterized protein n=1 Tax=Suillus placidus TaxID=48579 RepID=A0A9P7D0H6_9AGAM|nr:hypothetical protein EV702DRAFT_1116150 [Suillus placidus]
MTELCRYLPNGLPQKIVLSIFILSCNVCAPTFGTNTIRTRAPGWSVDVNTISLVRLLTPSNPLSYQVLHHKAWH